MLYEFRDTVFLHYRSWWFLWEPAWEGFRPIEGISWDGTAFRIHDEKFCSDPTDEQYGYGCAQMKELCDLLADKHDETPVKVSTLPIGSEWFRDRVVALTPCARRDVKSWKRMVLNKPRTCRNAPRGKKRTRRIRG